MFLIVVLWVTLLIVSFSVSHCVIVGNVHRRVKHLQIISFSVVFPLTMSLSEAFSRREKALQNLAELQAMVLSQFYAHAHWDCRVGSYYLHLLCINSL